mgnify:CR=1 FL=1
MDGQPSECYVVSELEGASSPGWDKVRIPLRSRTRAVGNIDDVKRMRAVRRWTQGHDAPVTMRMARLRVKSSMLPTVRVGERTGMRTLYQRADDASSSSLTT